MSTTNSPETSNPPGLSEWEAKLLAHIRNHIDTEHGMIGEYEALVQESDAGHVKYLLRMVAEDEARHHRIFEQWGETILAMASLTEAENGVPFMHREANAADLARRVDDLLDVEKEDAAELRKLTHELKDVRDTTLWALLVELMRLDTEKHIKILKFVRDHARETARQQVD